MNKLAAPTLLFSLTLAACGGGGGGGSSSPGSGTVPVTPQAKIQTVSVQRAVATQSLQGVQDTKTTYTFVGGGAQTFSVVRRALDRAGRQVTGAYRSGMSTQAHGVRNPQSVAYGPCQSSSESASVTVSSTEQQVYVRTFYDTACTQLHQDVYIDAIATSATSATGTGTQTSYTTSGSVYQYETVSLSMGGFGTQNQTVSLYVTDAVNQTSPTLAVAGIACGTSSTSLSCGFGGVVHSQTLAQDSGGTINVSAGMTGSASTGVTVSMNGSGSESTGALNALTLTAGTFPAWTVNGGSVIDSASLTGQLTFSSLGAIQGGSLSLSDSADDGTVTVIGSSTGVSGVIKQTSTGQQIATFAVDQNGNGTITYSSGITGQIVTWQVIG